MKNEGMAGTVLGVTPVLVRDTFEGDGPVAREAPTPVEGGDEQEDDGQRPTAGIQGKKQEGHGREDTPIRVVDGHVLVEEAEGPDDEGGEDVGAKECRQGLHGQRCEVAEQEDAGHAGEEVDGGQECYAEGFGIISFHAIRIFCAAKVVLFFEICKYLERNVLDLVRIIKICGI